MNLKDLLSVSFRFIRVRFLESLMVVLGLAFGVAITSSLFSLIGAYNSEMETRSNTPQQREIKVESNRGWHPFPGGEAPAVKINDTQTKHIVFTVFDLTKAGKACPDVEYSYISFGSRFSVADTSALSRAEVKDFECRMVSYEYFTANNMEIAYGSLFTESDIQSSNSVIVLDKKLAANLFPDKDNSSIVGNNITLSLPDYGGNLTFTVIGVLKHSNRELTVADPAAGNSGTAYCPYTLSTQYRSQKGLDTLSFSVMNIKNLQKAVYQIENYFSGIYGENAISIHSSLNWEKDQRRIIIPFFSIITFFVGAGLLMAAMNILNLMLARITRQKKNIGIMKSIGASRFDIFKLFLTESLTIGVMGGVTGCGIAFLLSLLLQLLLNSDGTGGGPQLDIIRGAGPEINVTFSILAVALLLTLILNAVFGLYPAYKASRIEPTDALRSD